MQRRPSFEPLEGRQLMAVFTVTTLSDAPVTMPGQAPGTLRQAIFDANSLPGADVIEFQSGLAGAISLSIIGDSAIGSSALLIDSEVTIRGNTAGITVERDAAAPDMRLFHVASTGSLRLESVSLTGGTARGLSDAEGRGGAIYSEGTLEIVASTLYDNQAVGGNAAVGIYGERGLGGAIYNDAGTVLLENATLSGNTAQSGTGSTVLSSLGGGIFSRNGEVAIYNSTITNSTASTGRGLYVLADDGTAIVDVYSSIIAQSDAPSLARDFVVAEDTGGQALIGGSENLIRTHNVYPEITIPDTDDPLLGNLTNNGGPTPTHALSTESLAIDAGANPRSLATDQRGTSYARVIGGQIDIGAFELQTVIGPVLPGDYNGNGIVDAADYVLWRKTLGTPVDPFSGADGDGDGTIDTGDYSVWRDNFHTGNVPAAIVKPAEEPSLAGQLAIGTFFARSKPSSGSGNGQGSTGIRLVALAECHLKPLLEWSLSAIATMPEPQGIVPDLPWRSSRMDDDDADVTHNQALNRVWDEWPRRFVA